MADQPGHQSPRVSEKHHSSSSIPGSDDLTAAASHTSLHKIAGDAKEDPEATHYGLSRHVNFAHSTDFGSNPNTNLTDSAADINLARQSSYRQRTSLSGGDDRTNFGEPSRVDYDEANADFQQLQQTLSRHSSVAGLEEGGLPLDIRNYLTQQAGDINDDRVKQVGVVWENLTVIGSGSDKAHIENVFTPIVHNLMRLPTSLGSLLRGKGLHPNQTTKTILHDLNGFCRPGEMVLVLGKPGAGCSTLLRALGNQRKTYKEVRGDVTYGGIAADEFAKHYRGEVVYNQEDDHHHPTYTVRETINFALKSRTMSRHVVDDRDKLREEVLDLLIRMFGLQRCADTIVGNAMMRGVSGGEKKRTSIAEQMATAAAVTLWDGSTKGLDASSALDYVRSLRIVADLFQRTTLVTLYQASENIYNLFDKVLLLAEGRCIYYGPAQEAKSYFQGLGFECPNRQTTSDFLTGITMKHEARIAMGMESLVPRSPEDFEARYRASPEYAQLMTELATYKEEQAAQRPDEQFRKAVEEGRMGSHKSNVRRKSPYQTTYFFQITNTMRREVSLLLGSKGMLVFRYVYNAIMAVIVGSLFYQLPTTSDGAFTRGGALFFALLFNTLMANAEVPKSFDTRPILYKQKGFAFYHPSAQFFAQTVADIPLYFVQIAIFTIILYWMVGLQAEAGKFFFFMLILFVTSLCLSALFRMVGQIAPDVHTAHVLSGLFLMFFINLTGYLIPPKDMGGWVIWIYWINPIAYGLKALLSNEFRGLRLECVGYQLIPSGIEKYSDINHQVCTLLGSTPGSRFVNGEDYLYATYGFKASDMWIDFAAIIGFWVLFMLITVVVVEQVEFGKGGYSTNVFKAKRTPPTVSFPPNGADEAVAAPEGYEGVKGEEAKAAANLPVVTRGLALTWNDVDYIVPGKKRGEEIQLLRKIFGYVQPGSMTALMGASGAGKTTLLDVLAQRKNLGRTEGDILMNGVPLTKVLRRKTGYCEQMDIHNPNTTVREALQFSAYLRQPANVSRAEKDLFVEKVIHLLEMEDIGDALVGNCETGIGLSMEERKRLTIGVELVAKPKVLFLDEPTSGLDAQASFSIVRFLRKLAREGQSVLCTIHQPSSLLFEQFDRLLLLAPGGRMVYFGDLGHNCETIINYYESHGAPRCPSDANPAEYILDVVGSRQEKINWPETYSNSELARSERAKLAAILENEKAQQAAQGPNGTISGDPDEHREFALGFWGQARYVVKRNYTSYWRDPEYNLNRYLLQVMVAIILGLCFLRLGYGSGALQNRVMVIFQTTIMGILIINQVEPQLIAWRRWFTREEASGMYSWKAFTTGMVLTEIPYIIGAATIFFLILYWFVNLNPLSERVGYFFIILVAFYFYSLSFGFMVASFSPSDVMAALVNPFPASILALFCGVTIPYLQMPAFWRRWVYWINPYKYYIEGVISNDLYDMKITCEEDEYLKFDPPSGNTCYEYAKEFLSVGPGYIRNLNDTSSCEYCPFKVGQEFTDNLSWEYSNKWRNFGILFAFVGFNLIVTCIGLKYYRANKR
ncbi:ATP-binding cassette transporter snq2 [Tieghemiomyces parasiticus]|uniref:ATP-binding cassette transporter snq2 n=1 Tax=Tieghemiomyces parasiticus TaxID=78921 RepID=A0A9W8AFW9_9FUNG|nr:ATP-binding cassette transporter snq2 [Tieghemiomyces parasiticus]